MTMMTSSRWMRPPSLAFVPRSTSQTTCHWATERRLLTDVLSREIERVRERGRPLGCCTWSRKPYALYESESSPAGKPNQHRNRHAWWKTLQEWPQRPVNSVRFERSSAPRAHPCGRWPRFRTGYSSHGMAALRLRDRLDVEHDLEAAVDHRSSRRFMATEAWRQEHPLAECQAAGRGAR